MNKIYAEIVAYEAERSGKLVHEVNEHPWAIRLTHWLNTVSLFILIGSGLRIFLAFPSFGPKIPQKNFFLEIPRSLTIGGWLGGALQWHITFIWIYMGTGVVYLVYQLTSSHYKRVLFTHRDIPGVWPMVRHYFFFRTKPTITEQYNPLQKLAYSSVILLGILSVLTGLVLYNPVQFSFLSKLMGGFHLARTWHFAVMCAFVLFVIGHVVMVVLHGWNNFVSMLTGWKRNPEYLLDYSLVIPDFSQAGEEVDREEMMEETDEKPNEIDPELDKMSKILEEKDNTIEKVQNKEEKVEIVEDTKEEN